MGRRKSALMASGAIMIAVTILILALSVKDWSGITPLTAVFLLWAEAALFGGLIAVESLVARTEQIIIRSSWSILILSYSAAVFFVALVFMLLLKNSLTAFLVIQLILMAVTAISLIVFYTAGRNVKDSSSRGMKNAAPFESYIHRLNMLAEKENVGEYGARLRKMAEDLHSDDISKAAMADSELEAAISGLELTLAGDKDHIAADAIREHFVKLNSLIAEEK